jgi:hypothetical protein
VRAIAQPPVGRPEHNGNGATTALRHTVRRGRHARTRGRRCAQAPQTPLGTPVRGPHRTSGYRQLEFGAAILRGDPPSAIPIDRPKQKTRRPPRQYPCPSSGTALDTLAPAHPARGPPRPALTAVRRTALIRTPRSTAGGGTFDRHRVPPRDVPGERRQGHCRFTHTAPSGRPSRCHVV